MGKRGRGLSLRLYPAVSTARVSASQYRPRERESVRPRERVGSGTTSINGGALLTHPLTRMVLTSGSFLGTAISQQPPHRREKALCINWLRFESIRADLK